MNECMKCWEAILPQTVRHPTIPWICRRYWRHYQSKYRGGDVFRLRRRISVCGSETRSRRDTRHREDRGP